MLSQLNSQLTCTHKDQKMMEESGIETTPPVSPVPPVTVSATDGPPPKTTGKTWPV